jgi:hypothetical protein
VTPVERRAAVTADEPAITAIVRAAYVGYVGRIGRAAAHLPRRCPRLRRCPLGPGPFGKVVLSQKGLAPMGSR